MRRRAACFAVLGTLALLGSLSAGCGSSDRREGAIGPAAGVGGVVQQGDPALAAAPGYAGSGACKNCHPNQFTGWSRSLHNAPLKTVAELGAGIFVNDGNNNGTNDFQDGLDFNNPATDALIENNPNGAALKNSRPNAPILRFVNGKFIVSIGGVEFEIQRTQGGNGYWKQRYQTKVGKSYYISPVQYNEVSGKYEAYNPNRWYALPSTPRFTRAYGTDNLVAQFGALNTAAAGRLGTAQSWENRCSGCHQTGLTLESQTRIYAGGSVTEVVSGYAELNIGCEACHGPGASHIASRNPADIINPGNFKALGVAGIRLADQVCGRCHHRGEGNATLAGMSLNVEFPARSVGGALQLPLPGSNVLDNSAGNPFVILNTSTAYYGAASPTLGIHSAYRNWYGGATFIYSFPRYIADRQHHQAWTSLEQGPHAPDTDADITCFGCHDPHKASGNPKADPGDDHQIRDSLTVGGVTIATRDDDNSLCLSCHSAEFGLTANDVRINGAAVRNAVSDHMGEEAVMAGAPYDPAGTGVGRCSSCHMPKTSSSAIRTAVGAGLQEGDIRNHSFNVIWPSVNYIRHDNGALKIDNTMVSSCYQNSSGACHNNNPAGPRFLRQLDDWSRSGHANFTDVPFRAFDARGAISSSTGDISCSKCHGPHGFEDYVEDEAVNVAARPSLSGISCDACHTGGLGQTRYTHASRPASLDNVLFPSGIRRSLGDSSNICMACHQGRASKAQVDAAIAADPNNQVLGDLTFVNIHYFAAAATFFGAEVRGGYEYDGKAYVGRFLHTPARDTCIECHMGVPAEASHVGRPKAAFCSQCHPVVNVPADFRSIRASAVDYNGNGNASEGIYREIWGTGVNLTDNVANRLLGAVQAYAAANLPARIAYDPDTSPYWFKDTNGNGAVDPGENVSENRYNRFDATLLRAAYNYQVVQKEPCGYIHNARYHLQLLFDSIEDLGGSTAGLTRP